MADARDNSVELDRTLVTQLVDNPDAVEITSSDQADGALYIEIGLDEDDIGKVIGRQGRVIKAIRTLARAAASQDHLRVEVELAE